MQLTETNIAKQVLGDIPKIRGLMWEKIKEFQSKLEMIDGYVGHEAGTPQSEQLQEIAPLKQHIEGGLEKTLFNGGDFFQRQWALVQLAILQTVLKDGLE